MERYLEGEDIDLDILVDDLETAVARGSFHPVLAAAAVTGVGPAELRPGRPAGRRGREDDRRPVRRAGVAGPGVLRHAAAGLDGARVRARAGRARARGPRRGREARSPVLHA